LGGGFALTDQNHPTPPADQDERKVIDLDALRRRAICKKRYGRATLTIRRWAGIGSVLGDDSLSRALERFRADSASAEDVAWVFVRSRVESHSPTFRWEGADLARLIDLVTDCSESPHLESKTPEALAAELVSAQDVEREQMERLSRQLSDSFSGIRKLSMAFNPPVLRWAEQQRRTLDAITRGFSSSHLGALPTPTIHEQMRSLGLTASVRKEMFPTFQSAPAVHLAQMPTLTLLSQRIRLPSAIADELSRSLNRSLSVYQTSTMAPALQSLAHSRIVTVDEVLRAAGEAATIAEQEGDDEEANELRAVSAEVIAVAEAPTVEAVGEIVHALSERIEERFDDLKKKMEANEDQRQSDRQDDLTLTLFLFFLSTYLAYFLWHLDRLPRN
jgi:hypothetical protein